MTIPLKGDEALLWVRNELPFDVEVYSQVSECYQCPLLLQAVVHSYNESFAKLSANYQNVVDIRSKGQAVVCELPFNWYEDQGEYKLTISSTSSTSEPWLTRGYNCSLETLHEGRNNVWPILAMVFVYTLVAFGLVFRHRIRSRRLSSEPLIEQPTAGPSDEEPPEPARSRLQSLDCFRGITILMMIFVNYGGGGYVYFSHSPWFGLTVADVIFPWFIFIMGTSIALGLRGQVLRSRGPYAVLSKIVKRSVYLFVLGFMLNSMKQNSLAKIRIPGVLQRFSVSYLVVASIHWMSLKRGPVEARIPAASGVKRHFADIIPFWFEWLIMGLIALTYFGLTFLWNFDANCPLGFQGPGGLFANASHPNCTGGAANALDRIVFGVNHIYPHSSAKKIYFNLVNHDPEGLLGLTSSILLTFFGLQAGKVLLTYPRGKDRVVRWLFWAAALGIIGGAFAWSDFVPICKNLWSFSYICVTGSMAFILLSLLYFITDHWHFWVNGSPFHFPGKNSILLYVSHEVLSKTFPFYYAVDGTSHGWLLFRTCGGVTLWLLVSVVLAKKKLFFSL